MVGPISSSFQQEILNFAQSAHLALQPMQPTKTQQKIEQIKAQIIAEMQSGQGGVRISQDLLRESIKVQAG